MKWDVIHSRVFWSFPCPHSLSSDRHVLSCLTFVCSRRAATKYSVAVFGMFDGGESVPLAGEERTTLSDAPDPPLPASSGNVSVTPHQSLPLYPSLGSPLCLFLLVISADHLNKYQSMYHSVLFMKKRRRTWINLSWSRKLSVDQSHWKRAFNETSFLKKTKTISSFFFCVVYSHTGE